MYSRVMLFKRFKTAYTCTSIKVYRRLENNLKETTYIDGYAKYRWK